jgi:hypothetical protein
MLTKFPAWKEALDKFNFNYGDVIPHKWFFEAFGLDAPQDTTAYKSSKKTELEFMANFKRLENTLLEERQIALKNIRSVGWQVVAPGEQTDWALNNGATEMKKALKKMYSRQVNVNHALLTHEQKKENADSLARTSMLNGMIARFQKKQLTTD